jgi:hypothetical protein
MRASVKKHIFMPKNLLLTNDCLIFVALFIDFAITKSISEVGSFLHQPLFCEVTKYFGKYLWLSWECTTFATYNTNKQMLKT